MSCRHSPWMSGTGGGRELRVVIPSLKGIKLHLHLLPVIQRQLPTTLPVMYPAGRAVDQELVEALATRYL